MNKNLNQKIYVAGHCGMVGSAIVRALENAGYTNIVKRTHSELDLTSQQAVKSFFEEEKPEQVYLAAAKVGGIHANNTFPAQFINDNLMIQCNVIHQAFMSGVKKLLFLGSSCIYPKLEFLPINESALLSGKLELTNEPYAVAKIAGLKMCESYNRQYGVTHNVDFRSIVPANLYGFGDNFHSENSHVIPALIRRFHEARTADFPNVTIWGTGKPKREFLFVDDMATAAVFVMELDKEVYDDLTTPMQSHINVGYGDDITIAELVQAVAKVVGYTGDILFDHAKPDGAQRRLLDSSLINSLGWKPKVNLEDGLKKTYLEYCKVDIQKNFNPFLRRH